MTTSVRRKQEILPKRRACKIYLDVLLLHHRRKGG